MKKVLFAIIATAGITASAAQYVTVRECVNVGDADSCQMMNVVVRTATQAGEQTEVLCGYGDVYGKCPDSFGVPAWLKDLNAWFKNRGFSANDEGSVYQN